MHLRRFLAPFLSGFAILLFSAGMLRAAGSSELADAMMKGNKDAVRTLLQQKADVNAAQIDGATALHWAARMDDAEAVDLLIKAGANVNAKSRLGTTPIVLAISNGNAAIVEKLVTANADLNVKLTKYGDTLLMLAAKSGKPDVIRVLIDHGSDVNARESYGDTTPLMWAVSEEHPAAAKLLIERGADVNARTKAVAPARGQWMAAPVAAPPPKPDYIGGMTPLMFAARQDDLESVKVLLAAKADVNAVAADGKTALALAIFNGNYDLASFLLDSGVDVNRADAEGFTPLFWAAERRLNEFSPTTPWTQTADAMPLINKLLDAGAAANAPINATPKSRTRGQARLKFGTVLIRAAFAGDLALVKTLLNKGADPNLAGDDGTTALMAASGYGFIDSYSYGKSPEERLQVVKLLVDLGANVNAASDMGITPLMAAGHLAVLPIIQYLVAQGADLSAHDIGKGNGQSLEPLMPIDYAIGVTTFQPNAIVNRPEAEALIRKLMEERGIKHTTSECTLRGFTCGDIDPKTATAAQISTLRVRQTGNQVQGITGGAGKQ